MLNADMEPLFNFSISVQLEELNTHGLGVDIEDPACPSVVEFVGHSFVLGGVHLNVHVIADVVDS